MTVVPLVPPPTIFMNEFLLHRFHGMPRHTPCLLMDVCKYEKACLPCAKSILHFIRKKAWKLYLSLQKNFCVCTVNHKYLTKSANYCNLYRALLIYCTICIRPLYESFRIARNWYSTPLVIIYGRIRQSCVKI
jgi:hypothetical protein